MIVHKFLNYYDNQNLSKFPSEMTPNLDLLYEEFWEKCVVDIGEFCVTEILKRRYLLLAASPRALFFSSRRFTLFLVPCYPVVVALDELCRVWRWFICVVGMFAASPPHAVEFS